MNCTRLVAALMLHLCAWSPLVLCDRAAAQDAGASEAPASAPRTPAPQPPSFAAIAAPPAGLPPMPKPADYEPTAAMFALGERLFHATLLSSDRTVSCASCHPSPGFASPEPQPAGVGGHRAARHAPALWNRGYGTRQRWDGSTESLEAFVLEPIADPNEMALPLAEALQRLDADEGFRSEFAATFGTSPDATGMRRALATFVRGITRGDAAYDRFLRGDITALSKQEKAGLWVFESKGACWKCHTPPLFTDERFHNTGIGVRDGMPETGHAKVTGRDEDRGAFKTPTLRGLAFTAPYMHDGSLQTLADVVAFYTRGGNANPHADARLHALELTPDDQEALVAFLKSL